MQTKTALFAGSFDPFTRGHQALVSDALQLFDRVVIAVGENISKQSLLSPQSRIRLIEELYRNDERVEVVGYSTLTGEFARKVGATALLRGLRSSVDFEYERLLEQTNRRLFPELRTLFLLTEAPLADISSSTVRELLRFGHSVDEFLPEGITTQQLKALIDNKR